MFLLSVILSLFLSPFGAPAVLLVAAIGQVLALRRGGARLALRLTALSVCIVGVSVVAIAVWRSPDARAAGVGLLFICYCALPWLASAVSMSLLRRRRSTTMPVLLWLGGVVGGLLVYLPGIWIALRLIYAIW
jgi:hypothetical protein